LQGLKDPDRIDSSAHRFQPRQFALSQSGEHILFFESVVLEGAS
jgi:hypothetical protein